MVSQKQQGFTLLELAIVLVIVGLITSMAVTSGISVISSARFSATQQKMGAIEQALMQYRAANDRLPCPGSLTLSTTNSLYGREAGSNNSCTIGTGVCTGSTIAGTCIGTALSPVANFTATGITNTTTSSAEGSLPALTLGLPADFMLDGWGNRFRYAVDISMTANGAFANTSISCVDGAITVNDSNGQARSSNSIYALISHGANGHGAYTSNGAIVSNGSANANELTNCHCTSTGATNTTSGVQLTNPAKYVQMRPTSNPSNALDTFDDLVSYKERWQMQTNWDRIGSVGCTNDVVAVSSATTTDPTYFYTLTPTAITGSSIALSSTAYTNNLAYSPDGTLLYINNSGAQINVYPVNPSTGTVTTNTAATSFGPAQTIGLNDLAISSDGVWIARAAASYYNIQNFQKTGSGYVQTSSVSILSNAYQQSVSYDPYANHLAVGIVGDGSHATTASIQIYKRSGTTLTLLSGQPDTAFSDTSSSMNTHVKFSPDGAYLYATDPGDTGGKYMRIYYASGDTFTYLTGKPTTQPSTPGPIAVSPDGTYIAVSTGSTSPHLFIYKKSGVGLAAGFAHISTGNLSATPSGVINDMTFTQDGKYLVVAENGGDIVLAYKVNYATDTFTALAAPALKPTSAATSVSPY